MQDEASHQLGQEVSARTKAPAVNSSLQEAFDALFLEGMKDRNKHQFLGKRRVAQSLTEKPYLLFQNTPSRKEARDTRTYQGTFPSLATPGGSLVDVKEPSHYA